MPREPRDRPGGLRRARWLVRRPRHAPLEQVPDVLPFWELIARWLRGQGYSVWTGCLSSERYGVPQTRERAILIASREGAVSAPPATHTAYDARLADGGKWHGTDGDLFGGGLEPWTSMAEGLDWPPDPTLIYTNGNQANSAGRPATAPAPKIHFSERMNDVRWAYERPATTVQGDPRIAQPGHRDREGGERQFEGESIRVTVQEAAILQGFPADYPWQGTKSAQHRQVGDAVPPLLAAHVIAACLGVQVAERVERAG